jgi:hypothetical protein
MTSVSEDQLKLNNVAGKLLAAAWAIEIIAACMGLFFSASRLIPSLNGTFLGSISALQGALPFVAVAIVEVTKIPLAFACYETNDSRWKVTFGLSLLAVAFVTFLSFYASFDSYQAKLTQVLQPTLERVSEFERKISSAKSTILSAEDILKGEEDSGERYENAIELIEDQFKNTVEPLQKKKEDIIGKIQTSSEGATTQKVRLEDELKRLDDEYEKESEFIKKEFTDRMRDESKKIEDDQQLFQDNLRDAQARLDAHIANSANERRTLTKQHKEEEATASWLSTIKTDNKRAMAEFHQRVNERKEELERDILNLKENSSSQPGSLDTATTERDGKLETLKGKYKSERAELLININLALESIAASKAKGLSAADQSRVDGYEANIDAAGSKRDALLAIEKESFQEQRDNFDAQRDRILTASSSIDVLDNNLRTECGNLTVTVNDNLIYRLATSIFGVDNACNLSKRQLSLVSAVWYGSIAFIIAVLGPILALSAFVLRENKPRVVIQEVSVEKLVEVEVVKEVPVEKIVEVEVVREVVVEKPVPVEVIKEVPVDKVVFKEVPVEIVKKEVVHIPVYTDDKSLLGKTFSDNDKT